MSYSGKSMIWIKALRMPFLTVTVVPVILGAVVACRETGHMNWFNFLLTLLGGCFIHLGLNLCNDYYDHVSGNDEANRHPTPFSGGSRVIQDRLLPARAVLFASLMFFILGAMIGLYLNHVLPGNVILWIGVLGVCVAVFYTAPPLSLGYRGFGEIFVALGFGPLLVCGSYYVQKQSLSIHPVWASIPVGILAALVLYINEFPDYSADSAVNKNTIVVKMGRENAAALFSVILLANYLITVSCALMGWIPFSALAVVVTLPLAVTVIITLNKNCYMIQELLPANAGVIKLHLISGLLLIGSYLI